MLHCSNTQLKTNFVSLKSEFMNENLKVSFYLKRERKNEKTGVGDHPVYPIVGKITIGNASIIESIRRLT